MSVESTAAGGRGPKAAGEPAGSAVRQYVELSESLPIPEEVDWDDAPTQFKVYRGLPRIPLGYGTPTGGSSADRLGPDQVGQLLLDSYGVTRYRWTATDALRRVVGTRGAEPSGGLELARNCLRPVPSGGSRFPAELYLVVGPDSDVPTGVHYYDAAHHCLVTLRDGDWTPELATGLGMPGARISLTLLASVFFWKNAFKYGELTYRLCGLDLGVLIGQILAVAGRYEGRANVRYQFVDDDLDRLLRLDPMRESVYAAITLGDVEPNGRTSAVSRLVRSDAVEISRTGTSSVTERDWSLDARPLQARVHRAARLDTPASFRVAGSTPDITASGVRSVSSLSLPEQRVDPLAGLRDRRSSMGYFTPADMSLRTLSALLVTAVEGYPSDLDGARPAMGHMLLFCVVNRVCGVAPGVYRYRPGSSARSDQSAPGSLELVRATELADEFQETLLFKLFNLTHTNVCVYPVGDYEAGLGVHGDRWYRMQNMEAGIVTQRLYLASAALRLRCHASLGYDVRRTNRLLGLSETHLTSLIQVMIGAGKAPGDFYEAAWR